MANYVSIYTLRSRVEGARRKIGYWQEKLAEYETELAEAEKVGEPPQCVDVICQNHSKFRVAGTETVCTLHLTRAIQAMGEAPTVETWPWPKEEE